MRHITYPIFILWTLGCAGSPTATVKERPSTSLVWPDSVAADCPPRRISLECFRKPNIDLAMRALVAQFRACHPLDASQSTIMLTVETRGGAPTCVEHTPRNSETGYCVARAVAARFKVPNSPPNERCSFRYPVAFHPAE